MIYYDDFADNNNIRSTMRNEARQ